MGNALSECFFFLSLLLLLQDHSFYGHFNIPILHLQKDLLLLLRGNEEGTLVPRRRQH